MAGLGRVAAVPPLVFDIVQMANQFAGDLVLCLHHPRQAQDLRDQSLVCVGYLIVCLLQSLHLVLRCDELVV